MRLVLAALLALTALPAVAGPTSDAVRVFYNPVGTVSDPALRDRFVDPALTKFKQDDTMSKDGAEIGCIDFSLAVDAQDLDDAEVARTLEFAEIVEGNEATVTATFSLFPGGDPESQRTILWTLRRVAGDWKVADIASGSGDWKLSTFECQ